MSNTLNPISLMDNAVGYKHETMHHGIAEIVAYETATRVKIRFENTGNERYCMMSHLRRGGVADAENSAHRHIGKVFSTRSSGDAKIVVYRRANEVQVQFLATGNLKWCTIGSLRNGQVLDRKVMTVPTKKEAIPHDRSKPKCLDCGTQVLSAFSKDIIKRYTPLVRNVRCKSCVRKIYKNSF